MSVKTKAFGVKEQGALNKFRERLIIGESKEAREIYYSFYNGESLDFVNRALFCSRAYDVIRDLCSAKNYSRVEQIAETFKDWSFDSYLKEFHPKYRYKQNLNKPKRRS